jgi:hypothetical protein
LERVSVLTRATVAGSIALSIVFTTLVAWAHPGRAKSATGSSANATVRVSPPSSAPPASTSPANASDDAPATVPASTAAPYAVPATTVPPSAYAPQPYVGAGGGGGGIVSGQT